MSRFVLFLVLFFVLCITSANLSAQNFLQLEKRGSFKTKHFYEGDVLIFKVAGDENWYEEEILEIMIEDKVVLFRNRVISIESISKIRDPQKGQIWRNLGNRLMMFGAAFLGVSLVATVADWELQNDTWLISGSAFAAGGLLRLGFSNRNIKMGKRKRLRPLNLDFKK